jgi:hypothetical protein
MVRWSLTLPGASDSAVLTITALFDGIVHPFEAKVRADLEQLAAAGAFAPLGGEFKRQLRLELIHGLLDPEDIPLLIERVEHVVALEVPARSRKPGFPRPPEEAHERKLNGQVRLRFIITEKGRAEPGSIRAVSQSDPLFIPNAIRSILESTFIPASSGGCSIRQEVEQNIRFRFTG